MRRRSSEQARCTTRPGIFTCRVNPDGLVRPESQVRYLDERKLSFRATPHSKRTDLDIFQSTCKVTLFATGGMKMEEIGNEHRQGVPRTRVQPFEFNFHQIVCVTCMRASLVRRDGPRTYMLQGAKRHGQQAVPCTRTMMCSRYQCQSSRSPL